MKKYKEVMLSRVTVIIVGMLFFICFGGAANAQTTVQGKVVDQDGKPLGNATVAVKETKLTTLTSEDGSFSLQVAAGNVIVVSSVGFITSETRVGKKLTALNIQLVAGTNPLDEVVVVAYGTQRKKDFTGSVAVVNVENARKTASHDVAKLLQGQVAGVSVQGSGEPGGYVNIKIRGINSLLANGPLFVIDGIPVSAPFDFSPDDIESVQVLKDASSAALYGVRAAGGVVIITTKKGKAGPTKVSYNGYYGFQQIGKRWDLMNREQYQRMVTAAELNAGLGIAPGNDPSSPKFINNVNTDWQKETYKTGRIQDHNVSLSGGSEFGSYNLSLGYFDQTGTIKGPQKYDRYTINTNMQGRKGKFGYGAKLAFTQSDKNNFGLTSDHAVFGGTVTNMLTAIPTMPVYDPNRLGGYGGADNVTQRAITLNVIGMNNLLTDNSKRTRILGNVWGDFEIVKNLKYKLNVAYDKTNFKNLHYEPKFDLGFYYLNTQYIFSQAYGQENWATIENTMTYQWQIAKHKIDFLAGTSYLNKTYEDLTASAKGTQDLGTFINFSYISNPADKAVRSYSDEEATMSYLGRINYNYDDRYLISGNFRRDGSSKFGPSNRYGNFASAAAAWNISNEKFIKLPTQVSSLKLRGGYGVLGNQSSLSPYPFVSYLNTNAAYDFNGALAPGTTTVSVVDPSLKWETTTTFNTAIDLGLFSNRFLFTIEYFNRKSSDLQANIPIPPSVGAVPSTLTTNAASTRNTGMEFTLTYTKPTGLFQYNITANASTLKNEVLQLGGNNNPILGAGSKTEVGRSVGELYGYITEGIFQNTTDVINHPKQNNAAPGDIKFKDINGRDAKGNLTGKPDGVITDDDRTYLGVTIPKLYYGFNFGASYKNFDMSFFLQGNAGNKVFDGVYQSLMSAQYSNQSVDMNNFWTTTNTETNIPAPKIGDPNQNGRFSDRFVESGSYLKLQNAQIGYAFTSRLLGNSRTFKNLRLYVSGQNLLIITKYRGYDPDFISDGLFSRGFDWGSFPNPRTVMFGVQLGL